jgi:hypothetical protein
MSTIRVDPGRLRKAADDIASVGEQLRTVGAQQYQATQGLPSYDGQFSSRVAPIGSEALARSRALSDRLAELSARLAAKAEAFDAVDAATLQGLAAIRQELLAWVHSQNAMPLADMLLPVGWEDRPPPGVPEEDWQRLTLPERITLWVEALRPDGTQVEGIPAIPVPPALTPDPGSGEFGSMEATPADYAFEQLLLLGAAGWEVTLGRPDAARHMRHYLEGSGEPLQVDVERMLEDMPEFKTQDEIDLDQFIRDVQDRIAGEYRGQPLRLEITSPWIESPYPRSENWYYATGRFSYAYGAEVTVSPPHTAEGSPTVEIAYRTYVADFYNWDQGKTVTIPRPTVPAVGTISLPIPQEYQPHIREVGDSWVVADAAQARLHLGGLAKEYEIRGQTETSTLYYSFDPQTSVLAPSAGQPPDPGPSR